MKKILILLFVAFLVSHKATAQKWAVSADLVVQAIDKSPHIGTGSFDTLFPFRIGVDRKINKWFGVNASFTYGKLRGEKPFLQATSANNVLKTIGFYTNNIAVFNVSPFVAIRILKSEISLRPFLGIGFITTTQTIKNEIIEKSGSTIINDVYKYKTQIAPSLGGSINYNFIFRESWSLGAFFGIQNLIATNSKYKDKSSVENVLNQVSQDVQDKISGYRANQYRNFGNFSFTQIGLEVKKYF